MKNEKKSQKFICSGKRFNFLSDTAQVWNKFISCWVVGEAIIVVPNLPWNKQNLIITWKREEKLLFINIT